MIAVSFAFYFNIYDLIATITNGSRSVFSIPGNSIAILFYPLNILYHYKVKGIQINIIHLSILSLIFATGSIVLPIFHYSHFESWRGVYVSDSVPIYLLIVRILSSLAAVGSFLMLRYADIKH